MKGAISIPSYPIGMVTSCKVPLLSMLTIQSALGLVYGCSPLGMYGCSISPCSNISSVGDCGWYVGGKFSVE